MAEHGAYMLLIMEYWTAGSLPEDDAKLARIVGGTLAEWRKVKPAVQSFFRDGWIHGRIDEEMLKAEAKHLRRSQAGKRGGEASAKSKQNSSNASSNAQASSSQPQPQKDSEAIASGGEPPSDPRSRLFRDGLAKLASLTGKGPDACRSFVGKCLKAAGDDAITVLGLIEEAERNQVIDPSGWIAYRLKGPVNGRRTVQDAARDLHENILAKLDQWNEPAPGGLCEPAGQDVVRLLPARRCE